MNLFEQIKNREEKISLIGLGYVGMPIAVAFAKKVNVIGFDISEEKVKLYKQGIDPTKEVGDEVIKNTTVEFTSDENQLRNAKFHIVAVPTPVNDDHTPDLSPLESACKTLGRNLTKGSIVVFESTVYPGVTEDVCIPILVEESKLEYGTDFKVGYSPERINPGDKVHRLETIVKVVSGMDEESLDIISKVYELVVDAGVYRAESIKVAEAAKVIENSQRDINIAFMNELSIIFDKMGVDTKEVLKAAGTKWNFLNFSPGLVGGHCIGVDPYYLTFKAQQLGYNPKVILSGREINDSMGGYISESIVKKLILKDKVVRKSKIGILGVTFKENCPDTRNSKVVDIIDGLNNYGISPLIYDPLADKEEFLEEYNLSMNSLNDFNNLDVLVVAVGHDEFKNLDLFNMLLKDGSIPDLVDVKGLLSKQELLNQNIDYWRL